MPLRLLKTAPVALFLALVGAVVPASASGQTAEVVEQDNFRQEPMGKRLATVNVGTRLEVRGSQGRWRQVVLSGWIWSPSVGPTDRGRFDLVVAADGGENLRVEPAPDARVSARLLEGFLLERVEERGDWTRVRRTAWMWGPSLRVEEGRTAAASGDSAGPAAGSQAGGDEAVPASAGPDRLAVAGSPARVFRSPDGDTLATIRPGGDLTVLTRQGDWARVRLEGWVRAADLIAADSAPALTDLTAGDLRSNPDQYRGRRVRWTVQFISLERAEPVRTDFYEGEPFILARPSVSSEGFVYLAVPPDMVSRVEALRPLQRIRITGRVRTGRSALMGAPVLDLVSFRTLGEDDRAPGEGDRAGGG